MTMNGEMKKKSGEMEKEIKYIDQCHGWSCEISPIFTVPNRQSSSFFVPDNSWFNRDCFFNVI